MFTTRECSENKQVNQRAGGREDRKKRENIIHGRETSENEGDGTNPVKKGVLE